MAFNLSHAPKAPRGGTSREGWDTRACWPYLSPEQTTPWAWARQPREDIPQTENLKQWGKGRPGCVAQAQIGMLVPSASWTQRPQAPGGHELRIQAGVGRAQPFQGDHEQDSGRPCCPLSLPPALSAFPLRHGNTASVEGLSSAPAPPSANIQGQGRLASSVSPRATP